MAEEADRRGGQDPRLCQGIVSFADLRLANVDAVLAARSRRRRPVSRHPPDRGDDAAIIGASSYFRRRR